MLLTGGQEGYGGRYEPLYSILSRDYLKIVLVFIDSYLYSLYKDRIA